MKILDIALKDLLRAFRSVFVLVFAFILPLLTIAVFYFAFGGMGSDDGGFNLPTTKVQIVNLDEPAPQFGDFVAGDVLAEAMQNETYAKLFEVTEANSAEEARAAVDNQEADVAVIIPANLTTAAFDPQGQASIEIYQDPTLNIGPSIVKSFVGHFVDNFAGSKIAAMVANEQLTEQGVAVSSDVVYDVASQYGDWAQVQSHDTSALFDAVLPAGVEREETNMVAQMLSAIMAGMMVFYAFFTGASASQSILKEEEEGTLARLFTTPTPQSTILGGKFIAIFAMLVIQVAVLVILSMVIFGIDWGKPLPVVLVALGLIVLAASFGIFVTSWLKGTKQAGAVYGGVLNIVGWVGISRMFLALVPGTEGFAPIGNTISLISPYGWALWGWQETLGGGSVSDVIFIVAVMLAMSTAFFSIGVLKFRKRFA
ncbi:MAG: ABC transporter permease [Anaerolineae bacterium]|nr:ABC transporter permease [Anaerolineae bacterium]